VYTQPLFALVEGTIKGRRADRDIPLLLQFGLRVVYVCLVTFLACLVSVCAGSARCTLNPARH
jgi:hypothetical protein